METRNEYIPGDRLRDIIDDNDLLLLVISRFSLPFGFGDSTIQEVCEENDVDTSTFLAVANMVSGNRFRKYIVNLNSLTGYLRNAHSYFLDFSLPSIRKKLIEAINCSDTNDVQILILKYFDDYMEEVRRHMEYENDVVFKYVSGLMEGKRDMDFDIGEYSADHDDMADKLHELKDIVIRHYRQKDNYMLNSVLYDIIGCQRDLETHCRVENDLLVPAVVKYEEEFDTKQVKSAECHITPSSKSDISSLSEREKEIVRCVARGLSNKEIADEICLSFHTVTTYRRNIAAKLQIHSPAGLTIFAIIHKLIDLKDIKLQ